MASPLEQGVGVVLTLVMLLDVFLTVLYARIETSLIGAHVGRLIWGLFLAASAAFGSRRGAVLSFCGPVVLLSLVGFWALGLTLGAALIMHPELGDSIKAANGETPKDFVAAIYAGGSSMAIVGASDFTPHTSAARLLFLCNSLIGTAVVSLTLTYIMQVYTALQQRNALAMNLHLLSACTGNAAELLARLGPDGQFNGGYTHLADLATRMTLTKEAHHFYPVLFYFRFDDSYHSVSRSTLVALDTVSLIESALDDRKFGWLKQSGAVAQLSEASMMLVATLETTFLPRAARNQAAEPDQATQEGWRARYHAALIRLRRAGIAVTDDTQAGAETYVARRKQWDHIIRELAPSMAYNMAEIDPAMNCLGSRQPPIAESARPRKAE